MPKVGGYRWDPVRGSSSWLLEDLPAPWGTKVVEVPALVKMLLLFRLGTGAGLALIRSDVLSTNVVCAWKLPLLAFGSSLGKLTARVVLLLLPVADAKLLNVLLLPMPPPPDECCRGLCCWLCVSGCIVTSDTPFPRPPPPPIPPRVMPPFILDPAELDESTPAMVSSEGTMHKSTPPGDCSTPLSLLLLDACMGRGVPTLPPPLLGLL